MSDAARRGRANRAKGQRFERWVVGELRQAGFADARRGLQAAGAVVADVEGVAGWWVECQSAQRPTPLAKLAQAERDRAASGAEGRRPVAVCHRSGAPLEATTVTFRVMLSADDGTAYPIAVTIAWADWLRLVSR